MPMAHTRRRSAPNRRAERASGTTQSIGANVADIQLSSQLFQDIQQAVQRHQPEADQGVVMQYLAAVMGYMLGSQRGISVSSRDAYMDELCDFARHVYQDLVQKQQQQPQAGPVGGQAFGYWEPPKKS